MKTRDDKVICIYFVLHDRAWYFRIILENDSCPVIIIVLKTCRIPGFYV